jgi:hypothetical protein
MDLCTIAIQINGVLSCAPVDLNDPILRSYALYRIRELHYQWTDNIVHQRTWKIFLEAKSYE